MKSVKEWNTLELKYRYEVKVVMKKYKQLNLEERVTIKEYIYENNEVAAQKVVSYIIERIETVIAGNPSVGRAGRVLGTRELVLSKYPYLIPYFVKNNVVYIIRILHTSRKWNN